VSRKAREPFEFESDRLKYFVDREPELGRAEEVLSSPPGTALPVLVFHGVGGMGKTSVLEKIRAALCGWRPEQRHREAELPHAWVDFSLAAAAAEGGVRSRTGMLHHIKRELASYQMRFERFELAWKRYQELLTSAAFEAARAPGDDRGVAAEAWEAVPGVGSGVTGVRAVRRLSRFERSRCERLGLGDVLECRHPPEVADKLAAALAADIRDAVASAHSDNSRCVAGGLHRRSTLSQVIGTLWARVCALCSEFLANTRRVCRNRTRKANRHEYRWPVLFFDSVEWLEGGSEEAMLALKAVEELCDYLPQAPVMMGLRMGERGLTLDEGRLAARGVEEMEVGVIPSIDEGKYRKEYLELRGVGKESWDAIIGVTGGHALWMGIGADIALDVEESEGRPVTREDLVGPMGKREELLERLLERLGGERALTDTVGAACVCRWFDYKLLEAVRGQTDDFEGQFGDLGGLSFVMALERDEAGRIVRAEIDQTVQELLLGQMRRQDLERLARRGAEHCEGQGEGWEAERVYFLMLAEPQEGIGYGGELFDRLKSDWKRALGEEVLEASRDGWWARHVGEAERAQEPWHLAAFEGELLKMEGNPTGALGAHQRALERARREADRYGEGLLLNSMAMIHRRQGRYEEAMGLHEQTLAISRELGDRRGEGQTLNNMANVHQRQGRYEEAMELYEQSLEISRELRDRRGEAMSQWGIAMVYEAQGEYDKALELYGGSRTVLGELGDRLGEGQTLMNMGILAEKTGDLDKARERWEEALEALEGLGVPQEEKVREWLERLGMGNREWGTANGGGGRRETAWAGWAPSALRAVSPFGPSIRQRRTAMGENRYENDQAPERRARLCRGRLARGNRPRH